MLEHDPSRRVKLNQVCQNGWVLDGALGHAQRLRAMDLQHAGESGRMLMDSGRNESTMEAGQDECSTGYSTGRQQKQDTAPDALLSARGALVRGARKVVSAKIKKMFLCKGQMPDSTGAW